MRGLTRLLLRVGMILILIGGCVFNVKHFATLTEKQIRYTPQYYKSPYYGATPQPSEDTYEEDEESVELVDSIDDSYYRERVSPSSYRY